MADQATVRGQGHGPQPSKGGGPSTNGNEVGVVGSITEFGNDVFTLVELQAKLAALDIKESTGRLTTPLVIVIVSLLVILASVPVLILGVADLIARAFGMASGLAMLLTAFAVIVAMSLLILAFFHRMVRSLEPLRRSREELVRNLAWLRTVLIYSGRSNPRRGL